MAHRLAFDDDFGVANAITAKNSAPANPPIMAPSGMKVKNTSVPL
jgi:hypothetical protein